MVTLKREFLAFFFGVGVVLLVLRWGYGEMLTIKYSIKERAEKRRKKRERNATRQEGKSSESPCSSLEVKAPHYKKKKGKRKRSQGLVLMVY
jgi:hypothetical protein